MAKSGITMRCVSCKERETLSFEAASNVGEFGAFCKKCHMPMVVESATLRSRRTKTDLRSVVGRLK